MKRLIFIVTALFITIVFCSCDKNIYQNEDNKNGTLNNENIINDDGSGKEHNESLSSMDMYENFINNNEEASFSSANTRLTDPNLEKLFGEKKYTLNEINDILDDNLSLATTNEEISIQSKYIDCGNDGEKELLITVSGNYSDGKYVQYILKNIEGSLQVLYFDVGDELNNIIQISDKGFLKYVGYTHTGMCEMRYSYLDANVKRHFYYGKYYYLSLEDFLKHQEIESHDISEDLLQNIQVECYFLSEQNGSQDYLYTYYLYEWDSIKKEGISKEYKDDNIDKIFSDLGYVVYSAEKIESFINQRQEYLGVDESINEWISD
ncbi:hypothetical protein SAMN02910298_00998 [Pseudobutyrivibrio sp. YE44]|uniref:hypothetical protein n=1 Tax=Pseudobutyrivibrio sp. YE44 TaxID=1520802 RepID=UPI00087F0179|nr:hypothetical protein [Pseudobutyrivibrio sp. YE44]SDB21057.1 hypothetical protein SAMN02910298_00998 [Pseudobutyrivibrio sp. YE44]